MADLTDSELQSDTEAEAGPGDPEILVDPTASGDDQGAPKVSVALSGGGHRASLFGLGALQYLADAEVNRQVTSIASVSGGSLTNAFVGQNCAYREADGTEFEATVTRPFVSQIASRGTLFAPLLTKLYIAVLIVAAAATLFVPWLVPGLSLGWRLVLFVAGLALALGLAWLRGRVCRSAFRRELFSPSGRPTRLAEMHDGVDHVLCATDLQSGDHFYFARDLAYGYQFGVGTPGDVDLADAAGASAALPGGFPPVSIPTASLGLTGGHAGSSARHLRLVDGGVYDNMADQWGIGYSRRKKRLPKAYANKTPDELIVVNASSGATWTAARAVHLPIVGEVMALARDKSILYDNTTSHRRIALIDRFDRARETGQGTTGAYVGINQSPYRAARDFADHAVFGARATAVIAALDGGPIAEAEWDRVVDASDTMSTNLSKLPAAAVGDIVWHAYVTTMANLHVLLDYPLLPIPDRNRFRY